MAERIYGNTELLIGAGTRSAKNARKKGRTFKKIKKNHGDAKRGREKGERGRALRDPDKCSDKGDKARRCALQRDEQELDSRGEKREEQSRRFAMELSQRKSPRAR